MAENAAIPADDDPADLPDDADDLDDAVGAEAICRRYGFDYKAKAGREVPERFRLVRGVKPTASIRHVFRGRLAGHDLCCFQQTWQVNTGQATIPVNHVFFITDAPSWPAVTVRRRGGLSRLLDRFRRPPGLSLDRPAFNRTFRVDTEDADFAALLLTPEVQDFLLERPAPTWQVLPGALAMIHSGTMKMARVPLSLERIERFWSMVPDELAWW